MVKFSCKLHSSLEVKGPILSADNTQKYNSKLFRTSTQSWLAEQEHTALIILRLNRGFCLKFCKDSKAWQATLGLNWPKCKNNSRLEQDAQCK